MEPRRCKARSSQTGEHCKAWAIRGGLVCRAHGGRAAQVKSAAEHRLIETEARRAFGKLADVAKPVDNPFEALATVAGEVVAWKNFAVERTPELEKLRYQGYTGEQLNAEVALFERALDRCVHTLTAIARLDLDEKAIRVSQTQLDLVDKALTAALTDVGLSSVERRRVSDRLVHHLRVAS
jgi:hypothetical protein